MVTLNINGKKIVMPQLLKTKLDNVKYIISKNWDCVFLIDGFERSGKSTLGITCAWYLSNGKITLNNISTGSVSAKKNIKELPDKSILIIDEGSLVFSSKDAMKREVKELGKILNVVGQKNMVVIIILPTFFELVKDIAVRRSRFLLHVYTDEKLNRGRFAYFGEQKKKKLYMIGKKNFDSYNKPPADFVTTFSRDNPLGNKYLELKKQSLLKTLEDEKIIDPSMMKECWKKVISNLNKTDPPLTTKQKSKIIEMSERSIKRYNKQIRDEQDRGREPII